MSVESGVPTLSMNMLFHLMHELLKCPLAVCSCGLNLQCPFFSSVNFGQKHEFYLHLLEDFGTIAFYRQEFVQHKLPCAGT